MTEPAESIEARTRDDIMRLFETPGAIRRPGPALGAHNREVYAGELGLSDQEIARLQGDGII